MWFLAPCIAAEALWVGARCTAVQGPVASVSIQGRRGQTQTLGEAEGAGLWAPAHGGCSASAPGRERGAWPDRAALCVKVSGGPVGVGWGLRGSAP